MLDEGIYEEKGWIDTFKNIFGKLLLLGVVLFLIFLLVKTFYFNKPKLSPEKIVISYLELEQFSQRNLAEKFLFSDFEKVEILKEKYKDISRLNWIQTEKEGAEPIFEIKEIKIEKKDAKIKIYEKTNRKEGWIFFDFYLPKQIVFEAGLTKIGSWKNGYQWKITRINSSDLILERKFGERVEIRENVFIKPLEIEKLEIEAPRKIYSLEIEYENNSNKPIRINPFGEWRIVDADGKVFNPPSLTSALFLRQPVLLGKELEPGETKRGYVMFETQNEVSTVKIILKNMEKKIIFEM
ncbi:DUF4352 domain-containing protein [Patescibacteria group bacterium]|nr:DUF4352 domain-containing protein [Patescibacteria group bacterium]